MNDCLKLPLRFDPARLRRDLRAVGKTGWIDHFVTGNYEGEWTVIPLRGPAGATHPVMMIYSDPGCTEFTDTPLLDRCPYIRYILDQFECELDAVRLMKLAPGSMIKEHRDHDLSLEDGEIRLHVPIATNPAVEFYLNGARIEMKEGECWYLRLSDPHHVNNKGTEDRVHLVIDARVNPWLTEILAVANQTSSKQ
ncbi:MAG: aspartyl/asparaginyl beta-hydroxylase domain-containing protein [Gammaproteobacteria bacterium]|nr:aspartyl/asparaginyl beta-hydroxylase domain-containing protein [Gammaproteobacteria bacterium]